VEAGSAVLIYASSPAKELVGRGTIERVYADAVDKIWSRHGAATGIDRETFDAYFHGRGEGVAIVLTEVRRLGRSIPLAELRGIVDGFHPPQSFGYVSAASARSLTSPAPVVSRAVGNHLPLAAAEVH
jgi:predicted transcriptional regulator